MKIAVISGSRADRGPLKVVYSALARAEFNASWLDVMALPVAGGGPVTCAHSAGVATNNATRMLARDPPDLVMLFGDRYEILGAAVGAYVSGYPIAHLSGGDLTEGSQDDSMRHAITKLAHIHFPDNIDSARRIIQMGESPYRVYTVGSPQIDRLLQTPLLSRKATFDAVGLQNPLTALLVCLHPNTLGDTLTELRELRAAFWEIQDPLVIIGPNADAGNETIRIGFQDLASNRPNTVYHDNLDDQVYISLLEHCDMMVGNSSAGLYEAPTFSTPAVNIGDRQQGRMQAVSVINCAPTKDSILLGIETAFKRPQAACMEFCRNPYGNGDSAERIVNILKSIEDPRALLRKRFHEPPSEASGG